MDHGQGSCQGDCGSLEWDHALGRRRDSAAGISGSCSGPCGNRLFPPQPRCTCPFPQKDTSTATVPEPEPALFQNPSKASQSSRDTLSSGVHSWGSQAEARSSSCNAVLAWGRPADTPSYFNGTAQQPMAAMGSRRVCVSLEGEGREDTWGPEGENSVQGDGGAAKDH